MDIDIVLDANMSVKWNTYYKWKIVNFNGKVKEGSISNLSKT